MQIKHLEECTTAGAVATVAQPFETVQKREPEKKLKGSNLLKGIKTSAKYANSLHEGEVVQFPGAHTHDNIDCPNCGEPMQGGKMPDGTRVKVCVKCLKYRAEPNQNLPAAAGTPNLSVVREGAKVDRMMENKSTPNTDQILYALTDAARHIANSDAYGTDGKRTISALYDLMRTPLKAGDLAGFEKAYDYCLRKYPDEASELIDTMYQSAKLGDQGTYEEFMTKMHEGKKVDRMVGHVKSSEQKLGKSAKEAENIAWATANKRGMLDNKNKKNVAEGSGGNWYIRVNGKILNDTKFKPVIFSSEDEARSHAMKLADKKRIPLSQIKLTKSWMDAPEQGVAEGIDDEGSTFKNSLHTIIRVATHLEKQMGDAENFPEWESEMVGSVKDQMVKIMDYEISKKEQQGVAEEKDVPGYANWYNDRQAKKDKAAANRKNTKDAQQAKIDLNKKKGVAEGFDDNNTEIARKLLPRLKQQSGGSTVDKCAALAAKYFNSAGLQSKFFNIDEYIKQEMAKEGVTEGRYVRGPHPVTGQIVDYDRQGNPKEPKVVAPKEPKVRGPRRDSNGLTRDDYQKVWRKIEEVVGNIFPDGDPIDWLAPWLKKSGIEDFHIGEVLDKASKLNGYKDIYAYYDHFKTDDYGYGELAEGEITEDDVVLAPGKGSRLKPGLLHKQEVSVGPIDTVKVDVPLLIRLLEYAREDAKTDMDLHDLAEKLIALGARGRTLTMKDYARLVPETQMDEEQAVLTKPEWLSKRKALQDLQMDPETSKQPMLKQELIKKIAYLKRRAEEAGLSEDVDECDFENMYQQKVEEVSDPMVRDYLGKAVYDTLTGKKDRNPGMKRAMNRLSGANKPLLPKSK